MKTVQFYFERLPKFTDQIKWRQGVERNIKDEVTSDFLAEWTVNADIDQFLTVVLPEKDVENLHCIMNNAHGARQIR